MNLEVLVQDDAAALAREGARLVTEVAKRAIAARGRFTVALAGGGTPAALYTILADGGAMSWENTLLFFGDERCVAPDNELSNFRMVREALLDRAAVPEWNVYRMAGEDEPAAAAASYTAALKRALGNDLRFDLVILGIGEDGHTASLFPGMPALEVQDLGAIATAVPGYVEPQVHRLTLTFPVLNAAHAVLFLASGAKKAKAVSAALKGENLPAARVRPADGSVTWLLDRDAAAGAA